MELNIKELESQLKKTQNQLNVLCSWIRIKFNDDTTLPETPHLDTECWNLTKVKDEEMINHDVLIRLVDISNIIENQNQTPLNSKQCDVCNESFRSARLLQFHRMTHCFVRVESLKEKKDAISTIDTDYNDNSPTSPADFQDEFQNQDSDFRPDDSSDVQEDDEMLIPDSTKHKETKSKKKTHKIPISKKKKSPLKIKPQAEGRERRSLYVCSEPSCKKEFYYLRHLTTHERKIHPITLRHKYESMEAEMESCKAEGCPRKFVNVVYMRNHMKRAHPKDEYVLKTWTAKTRTVDSQQLFADQRKCEHCPFTTVCRYTFRDHLRAFHDIHKLQLKCPNCQKMFRDDSSLYKHIRYVHENIREHNCPICEKPHQTQHLLNKHIPCHDPANLIAKIQINHICNVCGFATHSLPAFRAHMDRHSEKPKYKCKECNYTCFQHSAMFNHKVRWHSSTSKRFECEHCGHMLKNKPGLVKHIDAVHKNIRPYVCAKCGVGFKSTASLKYHEKTHGYDGRKRGINRDRKPIFRKGKPLEKNPYLEVEVTNSNSSTTIEQSFLNEEEGRYLDTFGMGMQE